MAKFNFTPTGNHFQQRRPQRVLSTRGTFQNGFNGIPRLGFAPPSPKQRVSPAEVAQSILNTPRETLFFIDTNFVSTSTEDEIWNALSQRRVIFTPLTLMELQDWFRKPFYNQLFHSMFTSAWNSKDPEKQVKLLNDWESKNSSNFIVFLEDTVAFQKWGYEHYMNLLSLRRRIGEKVWKEVLKTDPDASIEDFHALLQKRYGDRGLLVAKAVKKGQSVPKHIADEEILVMAFISSVLLHCPTRIITRDVAIQDQFHKLGTLMETDYRSFAAAYGIANYRKRYRLRTCAKSRRDKGNVGDYWSKSGKIKYIEFRKDDFDEEFLPPDPTFVPSDLVLIGGSKNDLTMSGTAFLLETEMWGLLKTKSDTCGRNTALHGKDDCRVGCSGHDQGEPILIVGISELKTRNLMGVNLNASDENKIFQNNETFQRIEISEHQLPRRVVNMTDCKLARGGFDLPPFFKSN